MKRAKIQKHPSRGGLAVLESVQVYCRVRPPPLSAEGDGCVRIHPPCHLHLVSPTVGTRYPSTKELQYTFKRVFDEMASQRDIFDEVALPQVRNLLSGKNSLLLTYGVTGSGKTYTMAGNLRDGGIMPRCFDVIFDSIAACQAKRHVFKPDRVNGFDIQTDSEAEAEADLQNRITLARVRKLEKKNSDPDLAQRVRDEVCMLPVDTDNCYAVFITYVEIYNNNVYDLLEDMYEENTRIRPLQSKIVREDSNHNVFVFGANEVEVSSTDEAFEAYYYGQRRRRIAQTSLNAESSRSHSIFNIRLVQAPLNQEGTAVEPDRRQMVVSQLSLVDLAGSERTNRTKNTGIRLKEAGNINNSLLTLRICLELLRENQNGGNKIIPYRDSRLTHIFRNFFDGDGLVTMVICVSPIIEEYEETLQVLKFAEMSQEITTAVQPTLRTIGGDTPRRRKAFQAYELAAKEFEDLDRGDNKLSPIQLFANIPNIGFLSMTDFEMVPTIKRQVEGGLAEFVKLKENIDFDRMKENLVKMERDSFMVMNQLKTLEDQYESERERALLLESKCSVSENQQLKMKRKLDENDSTIKKLKQEISSMQMVVNHKNLEQERTKEEYSSKIVQAQEKMNRELDRKLRSQRAVWDTEVKQHKNRMRMARQVLNDETSKGLPSYVTPMRPRLQPSSSAESIPSSLKGVSVAGVKAALFKGGSSISAVTNAPSNHVIGVSNGPTPRPTARKIGGVPVANKRHRRSRSAGNDVWLEHRPVHEVPMNTILQPVMHRKKSVTKLTDSKDFTEKTSKYCLMTQNQDSDGDLETRLYKGDVIPTCGGGAQVMFNDVEVLRQMSPVVSPVRKTPGQIREDLEAACSQRPESYRNRNIRS